MPYDYNTAETARVASRAAANRNEAPGNVQGKNITRPVVQRYKEEGAFKVSENNVFSVRNEGKPNSELFVADKVALPTLDLVTFEIVGADDAPRGMKKVAYKLAMQPEEVAAIHCGAFSQRITGKAEDVENETAPPGRSLFADELTWGIGPEKSKRGNWGNHFAPVLVQDEGDRGTFETAVRVDHVWFGIYGQKTGQTFRLKTVIADIRLAHTRGLIDLETADRFLAAIDNYVKTGSTKAEDQYLQEELQKIASIVGQTPDIDRKFREAEMEKRQKEEEIAHYWKLFSTENVDAILRALSGENPSSVRFYILPAMEGRAKEMPDMKLKIAQFKERFEQHLRDKEKTGPGTATNIVIGVGLLALVGSVLYWLANRKAQ